MPRTTRDIGSVVRQALRDAKELGEGVPDWMYERVVLKCDAYSRAFKREYTPTPKGRMPNYEIYVRRRAYAELQLAVLELKEAHYLAKAAATMLSAADGWRGLAADARQQADRHRATVNRANEMLEQMDKANPDRPKYLETIKDRMTAAQKRAKRAHRRLSHKYRNQVRSAKASVARWTAELERDPDGPQSARYRRRLNRAKRRLATAKERLERIREKPLHYSNEAKSVSLWCQKLIDYTCTHYLR